MDIIKFLKFNQDQVWNSNLKIAILFLSLIFLITVIAIIYLQFSQKRRRYKIFYHELHPRGFEEWEIKKIFNYLYKHQIDSKLFLESEKVARNVIKACGLDEEKTLKRLGFDTQDLIKRFLERQKELRKKWNK